MRHFYLFVFFLLLTASVSANGDEPYPPRLFSRGAGLLPNQLGLHFVPTSVLGTYRGLRFGAQFRLGSRFIIGGDVLLGNQGIGKTFTRSDAIIDFDAKGIYPEVKYIITPEGTDGLLYVSVAVPIREREVAFGEGSYTNHEQQIRYDFSGGRQSSSKTSVAIKLGAVKGLGGPLYYEYYAGFGVGRRVTNYTDFTSRSLAVEQPMNGEDISDDLLSERKCWQVDLMIGVKIGLAL